jgi:hypothetical protein
MLDLATRLAICHLRLRLTALQGASAVSRCLEAQYNLCFQNVRNDIPITTPTRALQDQNR